MTEQCMNKSGDSGFIIVAQKLESINPILLVTHKKKTGSIPI